MQTPKIYLASLNKFSCDVLIQLLNKQHNNLHELTQIVPLSMFISDNNVLKILEAITVIPK